MDFVNKHEDFLLHDIYVDDGFTGTNFNRPDFQRMLADIEAGKVNCVIVKDLSRFGRDYIDTGRYLERVFPELGVRFICRRFFVSITCKSSDKFSGFLF